MYVYIYIERERDVHTYTYILGRVNFAQINADPYLGGRVCEEGGSPVAL